MYVDAYENNPNKPTHECVCVVLSVYIQVHNNTANNRRGNDGVNGSAHEVLLQEDPQGAD